jgi:hypothetical protein
LGEDAHEAIVATAIHQLTAMLADPTADFSCGVGKSGLIAFA